MNEMNEIERYVLKDNKIYDLRNENYIDLEDIPKRLNKYENRVNEMWKRNEQLLSINDMQDDVIIGFESYFKLKGRSIDWYD